MMFSRRVVTLALAVAIALPMASARAQEKLPVVASFSILGDFVSQVGGDRVAVTVLVGPNGDAHVYQPKPGDARALSDARLIVVNGHDFESWMPRLLRSSGAKALVVEATRGIEMLEADEAHAHDHGGGHAHDHGATDPHAWADIENAKLYVRTIAEALTQVDPAGGAVYAENAARYVAQLDAVAAEAEAAFAAVPPGERRIITSHDAFAYFAKAYDLTILSPSGVNTDAEPTPAAIARLIRQVKDKKVRAVFVENIADRRIVDQIAGETGAKVGGTLYSDALSAADGPAATYIAMVRHNVATIADALKR
jgi:zinc/manganese transport system substrate-binding protein